MNTASFLSQKLDGYSGMSASATNNPVLGIGLLGSKRGQLDLRGGSDDLGEFKLNIWGGSVDLGMEVCVTQLGCFHLGHSGSTFERHKGGWLQLVHGRDSVEVGCLPLGYGGRSVERHSVGVGYVPKGRGGSSVNCGGVDRLQLNIFSFLLHVWGV
ncbi:hypothetical protein BU17DRAFT_63927 [Hysterangium stoloniferum]|nr:hypothetical protein BU17DRAFT_63927 [Hysterangium stoloniferum]